MINKECFRKEGAHASSVLVPRGRKKLPSRGTSPLRFTESRARRPASTPPPPPKAAAGAAAGESSRGEGQAIAPDPVSGRAVWRPGAPGFYAVTVVDAEGRGAKARVRIKNGLTDMAHLQLKNGTDQAHYAATQ